LEIVGGTPQKKARGREVSLLFRLDRVRAHASTKGVPSARVETSDDDDSYNDNVASIGHRNPPRAAKLDDRGSKPEIAGRTPRKKARGGEASLLFRLDCERRTQPPKRGGAAPD
jgi:hypothetical protein